MAIDINELDIPIRLKFLEQAKAQLRDLGREGATVASSVERSFATAATTTSTLNTNTALTVRGFTRMAFGAQAMATAMQAGRVSVQGLSGALLSMAPAGGVGAAAVAGLAAVAAGMALFRREIDDTQISFENLDQKIDEFVAKGRRRLEARLQTIQAELAETRTVWREQGGPTGGRGVAGQELVLQGRDRLSVLAEESAALRALGRIRAEEAAADRTARQRAAAEALNVYQLLDRAEAGYRRALERKRDLAVSAWQDQIRAADQLREKEHRLAAEAVAAAERRKAAAQEVVDVTKDAIRQAEKLRQIEAGTFRRQGKGEGFEPGVSAGGFGGNVLSTALGTALGGFTGAFASFIGSLFGGAAAAREAAIRQEEYRQSVRDTIETLRQQVEGTPLSQQMTGLDISFRRDRAELLQAFSSEAFAFAKGGVGPQLAELIRLYDLRRQQIEQEIALQRRQFSEDLEVRMLRARGLDEEAAALALALQQQREYAQAVRDGADAATLARLAEVQRQETIARAAEQTQRVIDSLTGFRNSLLTGSQSALSPFAQLEEARRQYDDIILRARGGDREAAGRLPEVGRAYLDASRAVNASGRRYAADFDRVRRETDELIARFGGTWPEEERDIARRNRRTHEDALTESRRQTERLEAMIAVLQAGFAEVTSSAERGTTATVAELRRARAAALN